VLHYLVESHGLKPDPDSDCALEQAIAVGNPESVQMIWDRADVTARVKWKGPLVSSIVFHHLEVARGDRT
jgi:hypothetical protein